MIVRVMAFYDPRTGVLSFLRRWSMHELDACIIEVVSHFLAYGEQFAVKSIQGSGIPEQLV